MELTIEQALQQGVTAHKEGKLEDAERLYRAILQAQPAHPDANHNLGVLAVSVNKADVALPLFKTALEANPKIEQFWLSYIDALIKGQQFDNAQQVLEQAKKQGVARDKVDAIESQITATSQINEPKFVSQKKSLTLSEKRKELAEQKKQKKRKKQDLKGINPSDIDVNILLRQYQAGQYGKAEKLAVSITQEFPKHQLSWKVLGAVLKQTGRVFESLTPMLKSVDLAPQDAEAHNNLGITFQELGRLDEAEASYTQAIALKPDFAEAHSNLGITLKELGRLDEAEASYNQAIVLKPDYADAHGNLGNTLRKLGRLDEAEASYNQAIGLKPDYAEAHSNLGSTVKEKGRLDEAAASFTKAIALKPDFAIAHSHLGKTLQDLGRLDEARKSLRQAIVLRPDYAEAHHYLGNTLKDLGRLEEAEASLRQAIALGPDKFADAYDELGLLLQKKGKLEEAEACYKKCMSLEPNKIPKTSSKGSIFFKQGLFEKALTAFESYDDAISRAQTLEALYALGRVDDIYERIESRVDLDYKNLRVAAIAAFLAEREKKDTAHRFCNNPIEFIHFTNISSHIEEPESFIASVIDELQHVKTEWELNTTQNGFQANIDVFKNPLEKMNMLKSTIINEIDTYYSKFKNETCSYIKKWPSEINIKGWHVVLKQQGHQTRHIHPDGWLSGVIYLMVVPSLGNDEGAIEFTLDGPNYPDVESSKKLYQPNLGDIVFFPSSLHHRTLPFSTDMDRICVSFDLMPA